MTVVGNAPSSVGSHLAGNVGFGTQASPSYPVDILSDDGLKIKAKTSTGSALARLQTSGAVGDAGGSAELRFYDAGQVATRWIGAFEEAPASSRYVGIIAQADRDGTKLPIRLYTQDASGTGQTALYVQAGQTAGTAGNVGVGTAAPGQKLEVNGGMRLNTTTTKPTCSSTVCGTFWATQGDPGTKDSVEVCAKDASDAYAWRSLY